MSHKLLYIFLFCILTTYIRGQETNTLPQTSADSEADELLKTELPPLDALFESARNSPAVEIFKIRQQQEASALKTEKRSWLKYLSLSSSYQYGSVGVNNNMSTVDIAPIYTSSGTKQSWYNFGGSISIPLDDIFDRGNRIKRQRLVMKQTEMEIEKWHDEQKMAIIESYAEVLQTMALLKSAAESLVFANAQFKVAENDFINGKITLGELSNNKSLQVTAISTYENNRILLRSALQKLEILAKIKILNQ